MSGQGIAGISAGLFKIAINFWWYPNAVHNRSELMVTGVIFFGVGSLLIIGSALATIILINSYLFSYYNHFAHRPIESMDDKEIFSTSSISLTDQNDNSNIKQSTLEIFKKIKWEAGNVFFIFLLTLTIFPGFTTKIRNYIPSLSSGNNALIIITIFQLVDSVGRTLPKWIIFPKSPDNLRYPCWFRIIFIPLFFISIYTDWFPYNEISYIVMTLFSLTNGYFGTLCMMAGPNRVKISDSKTAGALMAFSLQFGIFLGVNMAIILLVIIQGPSSVLQ